MKPSRAAALQAKSFEAMEQRISAMELLIKRMDKKLNILVNMSRTAAKAELKPKAKAPAKKPASK